MDGRRRPHEAYLWPPEFHLISALDLMVITNVGRLVRHCPDSETIILARVKVNAGPLAEGLYNFVVTHF
jgi:hypothetical protein